MDQPGGPSIEIWAKVARKTLAVPEDWQTVMAKNRGTVAVALSRGALLAGVEAAGPDWSHSNQQHIARWLGLNQTQARPITKNPSAPLDWLPGVSSDEKYRAARHIATRAVLSGWLDGPEIDLTTVNQGMMLQEYTGLAETPTGQIIHHRASKAENPTHATDGLEHMWMATLHALKWAAADGNRTQSELLKERSDFRAKHQTDPVSHHLRLAWQKLVKDAGRADSTGLAWIAVNAERLQGACTDEPCGGLDLTANIKQASTWGPQSARVSTIWQLIAMKSALDTFEASIDRPSLHKRLPQIVDAVAGVNDTAIELPTLRHKTTSSSLMIGLSKLLNTQAVTEQTPIQITFRQQIERLCDQAMESDIPDHIHRELGELRRHNSIKLDRLKRPDGSP
jgi:hypothetical protein